MRWSADRCGCLLRQAFTADELTTAKGRAEHLERLQTTVNEAWRQVRWTADVIAQARDRNRHAGLLQLRSLFESEPTTSMMTTMQDAAAACDDDNTHTPSFNCLIWQRQIHPQFEQKQRQIRGKPVTAGRFGVCNQRSSQLWKFGTLGNFGGTVETREAKGRTGASS